MSQTASPWNRDFFLLWQGSIVSSLGGQAYMIAIMLWAKQATESGTIVGAIMFAGGISNLFMPLGGVLADRYSRRNLLVLLDCITGVCVIFLALLFFAFPNESIRLIPVVLLINFIRGSCMALFHPVVAAIVPDIVPTAGLNRANAQLQMAFRATSLFGQSIAGLLFRVMGTPLLLLFDGITFLLSGLSECFIRDVPHVTNSERPRPGLWRELMEGWKFTGRLRGFRIYLLEASFANFFMSALPVSLPFLVEDVYRVSVDWYGYLLASMGLGAITGSIIAGRFSKPGFHRGVIHLICLFVLTSCLLPLAFVRSPWAAMGLILPSWICVGFHQVVLSTLVQKRTPREMRGRIGSLLSMIRFGLTPLGMALFGILIDTLGRVTDILFWTGIAGTVTILWAILLRDYRDFFMGDEIEISVDREIT